MAGSGRKTGVASTNSPPSTGGPEHTKVKRVIYPGLESFPQRELPRKQLLDPRGQFAPGMVIYFGINDPDATASAARG